MNELIRRPTQKLRLGLLMFLAAAVVAGCGGSSPDYPAEGPRYLDGGDGRYPLTVDDMIQQADLVAIVRPTGDSREVWNQLETFVSSRFAVEVGTVLKGDVKEGAHIELYAPGGHTKDSFEANSSRRPGPGDGSSELEEYVDWPFFAEGRAELVFLKLVTPDPDLEKSFYYNLGPSARYSVSDGELTSIYPDGVEVDDPGSVRATLTGSSFEDLKVTIRLDSQRAPSAP